MSGGTASTPASRCSADGDLDGQLNPMGAADVRAAHRRPGVDDQDHAKRILMKLDVRDRVQAVILADETRSAETFDRSS